MNQTSSNGIVEEFGSTSDGVAVQLITLCPSHSSTKADGTFVQICTFGAAIVSCNIPGGASNADRCTTDVVLGYGSAKDYERNNPYLGVIVGRVAGRIQGARFQVPGANNIVQVTHNFQKEHCLHGGIKGLSFVVWNIRRVDRQSVLLEHISPDGADGFPGQLTVQVEYAFRTVNGQPNAVELSIAYEARLEGKTGSHVFCPVSLTNHTYWNLAGHRAGREALARHHVQIRADRLAELRPSDLIPTGRLLPVDNLFDFRQSRALGPGLESIGEPEAKGYDDFYVFNSDRTPTEPVITVIEPESHRRMLVFTDQPGVQLYTGFYLNPNSDPVGKEGHRYGPFSGFCLETEGYPDACNQPNFPAVILQSGGAPYIQRTTFRFDCI